MRAWQREDPEAARPFREAEGDVEFQTDGTCVNTTGGWREVRLSIFAKRQRGEPVTDLDDWDEQRLPAPHARVATAAIRTSEALGPQWRRAAARLGIKRTAELTALADGAKWIWNEVEKNLPGAAGVLDIYHAGGAPARRGGGPARGGPGGRGVVRAPPPDPAGVRVAGPAGGAGGRSPATSRSWSATWARTATTRRTGSGWPRAGRSAAGWWRGRARRPSASG